MAYNTVRDKRSYLPQLKIVIHTDTNYEISQHVKNKSLMNIYQDKRIAFGDMQYNARSNLAVLPWNENVDREFT
jgi:hypothetical protein